MAFKVRFEKIQGLWYIILPEYIEAGGDFGDCLMVANTPELLDTLSNGTTAVEVLIDSKPITDFDISFSKTKEESDWAYYTPKHTSKLKFNKDIGLCPVNMFVWQGSHPQNIYIKNRNMKYFRIEAHFKLPDDFEGSIEDAIQLMLAAAKENNNEKFEYDESISMYENWWYMVHKYPKSKLILNAAICESAPGEWIVKKDSYDLKTSEQS